MKGSFWLTIGIVIFALLGILSGKALPESLKSGGPAVGGQNRFPGWNIEYKLPQGWQVGQALGRLQVLGSNTEPGAIFLAPGMYRNAEEAVADLSQFYQSLNLQGVPVEPPKNTTIAGLRAIVATYASMDQMGRTVHGRFISLLTPHGTGLNMLGLTTPEHMPRLGGTLERLAGSVTASPPSVNRQAIQALAGTWVLYQGGYSGGSSSTGSASHSHEETVVFDGQGSFQWQSSTSVSVTTPGYTGDAARATSDADRGTYTVVGNTLVMKGTKGQFTFDIQIEGNRLAAGGKTYLRN
jgi:hypothetical protein